MTHQPYTRALRLAADWIDANNPPEVLGVYQSSLADYPVCLLLEGNGHHEALARIFAGKTCTRTTQERQVRYEVIDGGLAFVWRTLSESSQPFRVEVVTL